MTSKFRHVALIGKYQAQGSRSALEDIARSLTEQGGEVALEKDTASNTGTVRVVALQSVDVAVRHAVSFALGTPAA